MRRGNTEIHRKRGFIFSAALETTHHGAVLTLILDMDSDLRVGQTCVKDDPSFKACNVMG